MSALWILVTSRDPLLQAKKHLPLAAAARHAVVSLVESLEQRTLMLSTTGPALSVANLDILPGPERMIF